MRHFRRQQASSPRSLCKLLSVLSCLCVHTCVCANSVRERTRTAALGGVPQACDACGGGTVRTSEDGRGGGEREQDGREHREVVVQVARLVNVTRLERHLQGARARA
eukprot:6193672-Pleurochrysis_carterae.AAC.2